MLSIDLREFFPSIPIERVQACFRWLGYPERVARLLTGLCANATPEAVLRDPRSGSDWFAGRRLFGRRHLPQGAPTSPALANLCCLGLDRRLTGLARRSGAVYTRYADDLVFSGDQGFERRLPQFRLLVNAIVIDSGFEIRRRKTRVMRQGTQQRVLGIVVNRVTNIERQEFDALKAELFNCVRFGPQGQNREGRGDYRQHLAGRVAWIASVHAGKGQRLRGLLEQIDWSGLDRSSGVSSNTHSGGGSEPVE